MRLLIIGDLGGQIGEATRIARGRGASVNQLPDHHAALEDLRAGKGADLIMMEAKNHGHIKSLVESLKAERVSLTVVACGVEADKNAAVNAIRAGAKEYIPLPPDAELIAAVMEAITQESHTVIHQADSMKQLLQMADQIAPSDASVLITGESGTGKEVIARYVQAGSKRKDRPFISVNCAAIPENLLESELFGHEKGAFTGAVSRRIGKFEEADGGTLLLDEISEMDAKLQAKLLRAIQEREIDRVGGTKPVKVDIRILATSNRDLLEAVRKGDFREDLYFRLNVINLQIPSLRERMEDVPLLGKFFAEKYNDSNGLPPRPLAEAALQKMGSYHWPGNVRELENTMHRAVLMAQGNEIGAEAILLSTSLRPPREEEVIEEDDMTEESRRNEQVGRTVASVEKELILDTLDYCLGNRTHAANILGISIRTLRNKLKQYGDEGASIPSAPGASGE
jgi:DNA-binding NtrC family response regulator